MKWKILEENQFVFIRYICNKIHRREHFRHMSRARELEQTNLVPILEPSTGRGDVSGCDLASQYTVCSPYNLTTVCCCSYVWGKGLVSGVQWDRYLSERAVRCELQGYTYIVQSYITKFIWFDINNEKGASEEELRTHSYKRADQLHM